MQCAVRSAQCAVHSAQCTACSAQSPVFALAARRAGCCGTPKPASSTTCTTMARAWESRAWPASIHCWWRAWTSPRSPRWYAATCMLLFFWCACCVDVAYVLQSVVLVGAHTQVTRLGLYSYGLYSYGARRFAHSSHPISGRRCRCPPSPSPRQTFHRISIVGRCGSSRTST